MVEEEKKVQCLTTKVTHSLLMQPLLIRCYYRKLRPWQDLNSKSSQRDFTQSKHSRSLASIETSALSAKTTIGDIVRLVKHAETLSKKHPF